MVTKLRRYRRPLLQWGTHRYMGPHIYVGLIKDETFVTLSQMVEQSQESVKDMLCHTTTHNNRLEFTDKTEHYNALTDIYTHIQKFTEGHNEQDWHDIDEFELSNVWVNIQHANQHIGHHTHEEADIAFVVYTKNTVSDPTIGHDYQDRSVNDPVDGMIEWRYGEVHQWSPNRMLHFPTQKEIVVFPGWLEHQVYPFREEHAERISIAGNINVI